MKENKISFEKHEYETRHHIIDYHDTVASIHSFIHLSIHSYIINSYGIFFLSFMNQLTNRPTLEKITLKVRKLNLADYETYHYDKDKLKEVCKSIGNTF